MDAGGVHSGVGQNSIGGGFRLGTPHGANPAFVVIGFAQTGFMFIRTSLAAAMLIGMAECFAPVGLGIPSARGLRMVSEAQGKIDAALAPPSDSMVWSSTTRSSEFHPFSARFLPVVFPASLCIAASQGI